MAKIGWRWDRRDGVVLIAAMALLALSYQPWFVTRLDGDSATWTAWDRLPWARGVGLALAAAALRLAYRRTPREKGAAILALAMVLGAVSVSVWEWRRASEAEVTFATLTFIDLGGVPERSQEEARRQAAEAAAQPRAITYEAGAAWAFYAGVAAMSVLLGTTVLLIRPGGRPAPRLR